MPRAFRPDFRFYFAEEDRTGDPTLPEYWNRDEYLAAVGNMFTMAYETQLDFAVTVHQEPENMTYVVSGPADMTAVEARRSAAPPH